jgi:Sap, sulfolipid-1-addressing protein
MNGAFFGLALLAALNPKLLAVDLLLIQNTRPRLMFLGFLLGCLGMALAIGLLDVLVLQEDAIKIQGSASAGLDLALGVPLVVIGALVATGRLHRRRRAPAQAAGGQPPKREGWEQRLLSKPRFGLAVLLGAVAGTPGADYVTALHRLVNGKSSTAVQTAAVVVFVLIEFSLVIIPFAFLLVRPAVTEAKLQRARLWLRSHARQVLATVTIVVGAYMAVSGLERLVS